MVKVEKPEMVSQGQILEMGWTKKLIQDFLPEPTLKTNPKYKCASPMKLWQKEQVLFIMQQPEFKTAMEKSSQRKKASETATAMKREKLKQLATKNATEISIKHLEDEQLVHNAISNAYERYRQYHEFGYKTGKDFWSADDETIRRWVVNYIRHKLTKYDKRIQDFERKVGKKEAYIIFQNTLMDRISEVYPKYKDECENQKKTIEMFNDDYY